MASANYDKVALTARVEVKKALAGGDTPESDLRASFRRALSFSIPPPAFYRNYCPGANSDLLFGAPLVDLGVNEDKVPKVLRRCIDEVEKRGLNANRIYSVSQARHMSGFMFSAADGTFARQTSTTGQSTSPH
jgi:hypothetical protein